jgi:hypothetical protein
VLRAIVAAAPHGAVVEAITTMRSVETIGERRRGP